MFEKEAEEYYNGQYDAWLEGEDSFALEEEIEQAFKDGAEFGYNKANEWHYVKDGDLPKENKDCLVVFHNKYSDNIVKSISRYSVELKKWWFIHNLEDMEEDVIAWKEIVLPELPKESE